MFWGEYQTHFSRRIWGCDYSYLIQIHLAAILRLRQQTWTMENWRTNLPSTKTQPTMTRGSFLETKIWSGHFPKVKVKSKKSCGQIKNSKTLTFLSPTIFIVCNNNGKLFSLLWEIETWEALHYRPFEVTHKTNKNITLQL